MKSSEEMLRSLIREIYLRESTIATLSLIDTTTGQAPDVITRVLSPGNAKFMKKFIDDHDRRGKMRPLPDWLKYRIARIKKRLGEDVAEVVNVVVSSQNGDDPTTQLGKIIQDHGQDFVQNAPTSYVLQIPEYLKGIAFSKRGGSTSENVGKGEALVILIFGRDDDSQEPDLTIAGSGYSVKFFEDVASTTKSGKLSFAATLDPMKNDMQILFDLARLKGWRAYRAKATGQQITRPAAQELFNWLRDPAQLDQSTNTIVGEPASYVLNLIKNAVPLWNTSMSDYPMFALHGGDQGVYRLELIPTADVRLGTLRFNPNVPSYEIASPTRAKLPVS